MTRLKDNIVFKVQLQILQGRRGIAIEFINLIRRGDGRLIRFRPVLGFQLCGFSVPSLFIVIRYDPPLAGVIKPVS